MREGEIYTSSFQSAFVSIERWGFGGGRTCGVLPVALVTAAPAFDTCRAKAHLRFESLYLGMSTAALRLYGHQFLYIQLLLHTAVLFYFFYIFATTLAAYSRFVLFQFIFSLQV